MKKVRFKTWYWGNYCLAPENMALPEGFELYDESLHGWHNSEEFIQHGKPEYMKDGTTDRIESFLESSYYVNNFRNKSA